MTLRWLALALLLLPGLAVPISTGHAQEARPDFSEIIRSTVRIKVCNKLKAPTSPISIDIYQAAYAEFVEAARQAEQQGGPFPDHLACSWGSGTVLDPSGRILTNAHVAIDEATTESGIPAQVEPLWGLVLRTTDSRNLPEPMFFAYAVTWSPMNRLDLAVLQPAYALDGTPLQPGDISLPPLPVAPPGSIDVGDSLVSIGYPKIGGELITLFEGSVSGFESDERVPQMGQTAWIKTDSTLGGGISGGTSLNEQGQLVGVPTELGDIEIRGDVNVGQINHVRPIPEAFAVLAEIGKGAPIGPDGLPVADAPGAPPEPDAPDAQPAPPDAPPAPDPQSRPANAASAAFVSGRVVSADTGAGIGRAQILVLEPGVTVAQYRAGRTGAVRTFAVTAGDGSFTLPKQVAVGEAYGVLVMATGFRTAEQDGVVLAPEGSGTAVTLDPFSLARRR